MHWEGIRISLDYTRELCLKILSYKMLNVFRYYTRISGDFKVIVILKVVWSNYQFFLKVIPWHTLKYLSGKYVEVLLHFLFKFLSITMLKRILTVFKQIKIFNLKNQHIPSFSITLTLSVAYFFHAHICW